MRRMIAFVFLLLLLAVSFPASVHSSAPAKYHPDDGYHQYIRWIGAAREAARQRYPNASMVDLLYVGCKSEWPSPKQFVYKFWMREAGREFGVYVTVDTADNPKRAHASLVERADELIPAYGRWGRYAADATKGRYPDAEIRGYKPFGCSCLSKQASRQAFRFWIVRGGRNEVLLVSVDYDVRTGKPLSVAFEPFRGF